MADGFTAAQLLKAIRDDGGRVHRQMAPNRVFVLTTEPKLAARLLRLGGSSHIPVGMPDGAMDDMGGYLPARDSAKREYDIWIHTIPVVDEDGLDVGERGLAIWRASA